MGLTIALVWMHFIADFILQNDRMALNKSSSLGWLSLHCLVYSIPFLFFGFKFALLNGLAHFLIDFLTSRGTSFLWKKEERHWFFVLIGFDQALHISILLTSYNLFN